MVENNNYLGTQNLTAQTFTFEFMPSEPFPVQCSIDGGVFVNCECTVTYSYTSTDYCQCLGSAPYAINTTGLSRGQHNITFSVTIDGVVRGLATETFTVLEGTEHKF